MFGVYVYVVAHHEASFGLEGASTVPTPPACEHGWQF
jgi:hypothetical protein